jgi:hypothetical protein
VVCSLLVSVLVAVDIIVVVVVVGAPDDGELLPLVLVEPTVVDNDRVVSEESDSVDGVPSDVVVAGVAALVVGDAVKVVEGAPVDVVDAVVVVDVVVGAVVVVVVVVVLTANVGGVADCSVQPPKLIPSSSLMIADAWRLFVVRS